MPHDRRRLGDILDCCNEIATYLEECASEQFLHDRMRQRAVERLLTILGEAAKHLSDETRNAIPQPWREIIRFRDKGTHAYDALTPETLYRIATESVPALCQAIQRFPGSASSKP